MVTFHVASSFHFNEPPFPCLSVKPSYKSYALKWKQYYFPCMFPFGHRAVRSSQPCSEVCCAAAPVEDAAACHWLRQGHLLSLLPCGTQALNTVTLYSSCTAGKLETLALNLSSSSTGCFSCRREDERTWSG